MSRLQIQVIVIAVLAVLVYLSAFVVNERQVAIKFKLGEIVKSDFEPGLYWQVPFVNNVRTFDSRIQSLDSPAERYLTSEKKNVIIDAFVKWRITDVAQFYRATRGNPMAAKSRLAQVVNNGLKNQVSQRTIREVISGERAEVMDVVRDKVANEAAGFGIEVIDVRVKKLDYSENISESVYGRMRAERAAVAKKLRSEGEEEAKVIRATAEREREEILAEGYREAQTIRGDGDAEAAQIYAGAFNRNPEFYSFSRSLTAYKESFDGEGDIMVIKPDSEFFKYFNKAGGR